MNIVIGRVHMKKVRHINTQVSDLLNLEFSRY